MHIYPQKKKLITVECVNFKVCGQVIEGRTKIFKRMVCFKCKRKRANERAKRRLSSSFSDEN